MIDSHSDIPLRNGEISADMLYQCLKTKGWAKDGSFQVHSACDTGSPQQKVLLASGLASHVFDDLLGRLKPQWRQTLTDMLPKDDLSRDDAMNKYREIYEFMLKNESDLFQETAWCTKCQGHCPVAGDAQGRLRVLIAGTECKAWSASGRQQRTGHPSMLTFLVFVFDIRRQQYDIGIHEITEMHPEEVLPFFLEGYRCVVVRLAPWHLGWPVNRPRKYTIITKESLMFEGNEEDFLVTFAQRPQLPVSDLWASPEADVQSLFEDVATTKAMMPLPGAPRDFRTLLTPFQKHGVDAAIASFPVECQNQLVVDISKTPSRTAPSLFVPTLLCSSLPWSQELRRWALPEESLTFQGIPCLPSTSEDYECSWVKDLESDLSCSAKQELAGNAMFLPAVGTVLLYALCSIPPTTESGIDICGE